jgi:hypothetical protein
MTHPVATEGDLVEATDTHIVLVPSSGGPVPTPVSLPFAGRIDGAVCTSVRADERLVAVDGSTATNQPSHVAPSPFQTPPANKATVLVPAGTVYAEGKLVARSGDRALTCNDPADLAVGEVVASGTVVLD